MSSCHANADHGGHTKAHLQSYRYTWTSHKHEVARQSWRVQLQTMQNANIQAVTKTYCEQYYFLRQLYTVKWAFCDGQFAALLVQHLSTFACSQNTARFRLVKDVTCVSGKRIAASSGQAYSGLLKVIAYQLLRCNTQGKISMQEHELPKLFQKTATDHRRASAVAAFARLETPAM